jgi:hypothetical protein
MVMSVWDEYDKAAPVLQEASVMAENRVEKQSLGFRFLRQERDCCSRTWGATATAATSARHTKGSPLTDIRTLRSLLSICIGFARENWARGAEDTRP